MNYLHKSTGGGILAVCMLLAIILPDNLYGQEVRQLSVKKMKKNHFLYVIGGEGNSVFTGSTEGNYLQPERKFPAMHMDLKGEGMHEETLKAESKTDILYTFYFGDRLLTLEYGDTPLDNGMYMLRLAAYNDQLAFTNDIKDTVLLTGAVFRYDLSALFRNYLSSQSGKWRRSYFFTHKLSPDGQTALVMLDNPFQTASPRQLYFFTLDRELTKISQHEISLPAEAGHMVIEDYALAADGKVYLLAAGYAEGNFKKQPGTFGYHFYSYDPEQGSLGKKELGIDQHFVTNLGLSVDKQYRPVLAGLYTNESDLALAGTVLCSPDAEGNMQAHFNALDQEIAAQLSQQQKENAAAKVDEYSVRHVFSEENGDLTFFAEHYSRKLGVGVKLSIMSGVSPEPQLEDHYGNILVVRLRENGDQDWLKVIPKSQRSVGENIMFNSFTLCRKGDAYGLAFNEQVKNMSNVKWIEVSREGDISEKMIFERMKDKLRIAPMLAGSTKDAQLLIPATRFGNSLLVSIDF